jgi:hypothetical protein
MWSAKKAGRNYVISSYGVGHQTTLTVPREDGLARVVELR